MEQLYYFGMLAVEKVLYYPNEFRIVTQDSDQSRWSVTKTDLEM